MYRFASRMYRAIDNRLLCKLPHGVQRGIKAPALALAKLVFRHKLLGLGVDAFVFAPPAEVGGWKNPVLPDWVNQEMQKIAVDIDPILHPLSERSSRLEYYSVPYAYERPGRIYASFRQRVKGEIDTVLLVPWLQRGGADLGALYFSRALQQDLGRQVLVVATEDQISPWAARLTEGCQFLAAGKDLSLCSVAEREVILARLLLQLAPRTVHIMNSALGWQVVRRFGKAIRQSSRLYASLYCDDVTVQGYVDGYARRYLVDCREHLAGSITDNDQNHRMWTGQMGVEQTFFSVVPYPAFLGDVPACREFRDRQISAPRVLWAGRLDRQKRPDVLAAIAARMPDVTFDVYGGTVIAQDAADVNVLSSLSNVRMHGAYDSFAAITCNEHVAFVHTSQWDGMPNILLEAASASLPIVAAKTGGIEDFLAVEWLVPRFDDVEGYVTRLREFINTPEARSCRVAEQWDRLEWGRSWEHFVAAIKRVPGYLDPLGPLS